jgi:hypothetical protein
VTGPAWFLLPIVTPILVMLAALVLQRFETLVLDQADPAPAQESFITGLSLPQCGFEADSVTPAELVSVNTSPTEAIPSPREPLIFAVDDTADDGRRTDVVQATISPTAVPPDSILPVKVAAAPSPLCTPLNRSANTAVGWA